MDSGAVKVFLILTDKLISMARKYLSLLGPLFVLLWIVGTNHCALEYVFGASASTARGECGSHPDESTDSHQEGQPCATKSLLAGGEHLQIKAKVAATEPTLVQAVYAAVLMFGEEQHSKTYKLANDLLHDPFSQPLISLSIASNAPPALA